MLMTLVMVFLTLLVSGFIPRNSDAASLLNVNSADTVQLTALPGIGEAKAEAIVQYRIKNGPFLSVENLSDVPGIGAKLIEKIRDLVTVQDQ